MLVDAGDQRDSISSPIVSRARSTRSPSRTTRISQSSDHHGLPTKSSMNSRSAPCTNFVPESFVAFENGSLRYRRFVSFSQPSNAIIIISDIQRYVNRAQRYTRDSTYGKVLQPSIKIVSIQVTTSTNLNNCAPNRVLRLRLRLCSLRFVVPKRSQRAHQNTLAEGL